MSRANGINNDCFVRLFGPAEPTNIPLHQYNQLQKYIIIANTDRSIKDLRRDKSLCLWIYHLIQVILGQFRNYLL